MRENIGNTLRQTAVFGTWIIVALVVIYIASGIYIIPQDQIGVLQRWGRVVDPAVPPGIHYAIPWPLHRVSKVPIKVMHRVSIDDFFSSTEPGSKSAILYEITGLNSYCISGDNNLVNLVAVIQYNIYDAVKYLFNVTDNERLLMEAACSSIIHTLAGMPIDEILTSGKPELETGILTNLQASLDDLGCGLNVSFVEVRDVSPPANAQEAFEDVINAQIDKKKAVNNAESYKNQKIPQAKADAAALNEQAEAYKNEVIAKAEGETERFLALLAEYKKAPDVTRTRLYLETITDIFKTVRKKYVFDKNNDGESSQLKLFIPD